MYMIFSVSIGKTDCYDLQGLGAVLNVSKYAWFYGNNIACSMKY